MKARCILGMALAVLFLISLLPAAAAGEGQIPAAEAQATAVHIASDPPGADIYLDGTLYRPAVTPCDIPVEAGAHTLSIRMAGYTPYETTVQPGQSVSARLLPAIPEGPNVRTLTVNRDEHGYADARVLKWEFYRRFVLEGEPRPEVDWYENQPESDYYPQWAYDALTDGISLREALCIIENDTGWYDEENEIRWYYVVEFAAEKLNPYDESDLDNDTYYLSSNVTCYGRGAAAYLNGEPLFEKYTAEGTVEDSEAKALWRCDGCFTINGDRNRDGTPDVTLAGWEDWTWDGRWTLMLTCSDARAVGLRFAPTMHVSIGTPFWQPLHYFDLREIYLTGCTFEGIRNGVGRFFGVSLGAIYGHTAQGYGQPGTYDLDGYYVTGCTFQDEQLGFIFAGGDQDYVRAKNLVIQGNHLVNGSIFVRNVDAHTWYMWPGNGEMSGTAYGETCIGYAEHNLLEDVTISGNFSEFTADVTDLNLYDGGYGSVIHLGNSNLGGSHNTMRNVTVRCNRSTLEQGNIDAYEYWPNAGVGISNAAVGDGLHEAYDSALASSLCQVSDNLFENLTVEYNEFALNYFTLENFTLSGSAQVGTDNRFRNIQISHNNLGTVTGLHFYGASGTSNPDCLAGGALENLTVSDNVIRCLRKTGWGADSNIDTSGEQSDFGILVCGASVANFDASNWDEPGEPAAWDKLHSAVSGVRLLGNTVTGFAGGVLVAAAECQRTHYVTGITVDDVVIADNEIVTDGVNQNCRNDGIVLVGAIDGGTDCMIHRAEVSGNRVSANNGLLCAGFWYRGMTCRRGVRDNRVLHVNARNNRFTYAAPNSNGGFPIAAADAVSTWGEIPFVLGQSAVVLTESDNAAAGFGWGSMLLSALSLENAPEEADFLARVQACADASTESGYLTWARDSAAGQEEPPLFAGVCDKPNYRPGNLHRWYLTPCTAGLVRSTETESLPTCTQPGAKLEITRCSCCSEVLKSETQTVSALGHSWAPAAYVWAADYSAVTASRTCTRDPAHVETETVPTTAEVTKEATEQSGGEITYTAVFANKAFATQIKVVATPRTEDPDGPIPGLPCSGGPDCPGNVFSDMPAKGSWAHDAIDWAVVRRVTTGTGATTFSPDAGCTRAQVVTFLWRAAGEPEPHTDSNPFLDVSAGTFYYKAVLWAVEKKITAGTSATTFSPDATCIRAQIVTFLWRFEGEPAPSSAANPFGDVQAGAFYEKAVLWASEAGVTAGTSPTAFSPLNTCTRAQVVTFLYRDLMGA